MAGRLFKNRFSHRLAHRIGRKPLERDLIRAVQAGLELPVRRQANPIAGSAEVIAHRADKADIALRPRQAIQPRHAAVMLNGLRSRQALKHRRAGNKSFLSKLPDLPVIKC